MSFEAVNRVVEHSKATGVTRMVLFLIASHESEGRGAFPAVHTLAREANAGERTIQDCISRAKKLGELEVSYRAGPHGTNIYRTLCGLDEGVRELRGADAWRESAPEPKGTRVRGSVVGSASSDSDVEPKAPKASTRPTEDQQFLAERICGAWGQEPRHIGNPALQKLNQRYGVEAVTSALRSLHGFPPDERVRSPYAYVEEICKQGVSA